MKIRLGYVSNSSSSSFIVKLKKGFLITPESIHELMFNTSEDHMVQCYGDPFSSHALAAVVANDLLQQTANDQKALIEEVVDIRGNSPDYDDFRIPQSDKETETFWNIDNDAMNKAQTLHRNYELKIFKDKNKEFDTYVLSYGDDNSLGSMLEHGGYLENFADRISHH